MSTLTIRRTDPHLATGRTQALQMFARRGLALHLKADGSADLLYKAGGKLETKTWNTTALVD